MTEAMEYFDCELDPPFADEASQIYSALVKLPYYAPSAKRREFCHLRVIARPEEKSKYTARYSIEKVPDMRQRASFL